MLYITFPFLECLENVGNSGGDTSSGGDLASRSTVRKASNRRVRGRGGSRASLGAGAVLNSESGRLRHSVGGVAVGEGRRRRAVSRDVGRRVDGGRGVVRKGTSNKSEGKALG